MTIQTKHNRKQYREKEKCSETESMIGKHWNDCTHKCYGKTLTSCLLDKHELNSSGAQAGKQALVEFVCEQSVAEKPVRPTSQRHNELFETQKTEWARRKRLWKQNRHFRTHAQSQNESRQNTKTMPRSTQHYEHANQPQQETTPPRRIAQRGRKHEREKPQCLDAEANTSWTCNNKYWRGQTKPDYGDTTPKQQTQTNKTTKMALLIDGKSTANQLRRTNRTVKHRQTL